MNKDREVPILIVVKKKANHEHHGGAWKVAFADFMTAMFALFLVLWLVNQSSDVRAAVAGYFQDPLGWSGETGTTMLSIEGQFTANPRPLMTAVPESRQIMLQQLADRIRAYLKDTPEMAALSAYIDIDMVENGLRVQLLEDSTGVFFELARAKPSANGERLIALLGSELGRLENDVIIEGYTDARPFGGNAQYTNWELSADRANAARRILMANGLPDSQIAQIRGWADRDLRYADDPFAPGNRRVTITVLYDGTGETETGTFGPAVAGAGK